MYRSGQEVTVEQYEAAYFKRNEKPAAGKLKAAASKAFNTLLSAVKRRTVRVRAGRLSFDTHMGMRVEILTEVHNTSGVWAKLTPKHGKVICRAMTYTHWYYIECQRKGQTGERNLDPVGIYTSQVAGLIKRHEAIELNQDDHRARLNYEKCGHRNKVVKHNCGCAEVTTIRRTRCSQHA
jgi:hypothetical protein